MNLRNVSFLSVAPLLAFTVACSSDANEAPLRAALSSSDAGAELGSPLRVRITVPQVMPEEEGTRCVKVRLGNTEAIKVGKIHNTLSAASHHLVVSAVDDPNESESETFECSPFRAVLIGAPLTVSQKHDDTIRMPEGVAFPLAADQLMHLEMHYINTSSEPRDVTAEAEIFPLVDAGDVQEASFLIVGDLDISVPPHTQLEKPSSFVKLPEEFADVSFYAATGHTHRFGTRAQLGTAAGHDDPGNTIYDPQPFSWSEAELKVFDQPLKVPADGGFRFKCGWDNPTDETLTYGESALQEMCFFWTYYYPRKQGKRVMLTGLDASPYKRGDAGAK